MTLAKYIRLSDADEDKRDGAKAESNSVSNQRRLLDDYIKGRREFDDCLVLEFLDDGHSGTNFHRPGITALLEAAKRGEVDCVIVKDFSRFGRNHIETDDYLERVFPFLGVRFIAINNDYDSANFPHGTAGNLMVGVQNLLYEMYSRDLSTKVKASKRQCAQRGQYINAYSFFGYVKSPTDRRALVPDPPAAEVVRNAFAWCLDGKTTAEIAARLNREGAPTPTQRKRALGAKRKTWNSERTDNEWNGSNVLYLLREERYTGKLIAGRHTRRELGKADSMEKLPKNDWIVIPDAFESLISQEDYNVVQKLLGRKKRGPAAPGPRRLFYRKLKCGCCGLAPERVNAARPYFQCRSRLTDDCTKLRIYEDELAKIVLESIHFQAKLAARIHTETARKNRRARSETAKLRDQMQKLSSSKTDAFVAFNAGQMKKAEFDRRCAALNYRMEDCKIKLSAAEQSEGESTLSGECQSQIAALQEVKTLQCLDHETLNALVKCIRIYDNRRIEIAWHFAEPYAALAAEYERGADHAGE